MTQHTTGRPGHPRVHHPAAAAGQHRQAGRRGERAPRRAERPGRLRHGRCSTTTCPGTSTIPTHTEPTLEAWTKKNGTSAPQVPGQHAQGVLRRRSHAGERLRLRLAAQAERGEGLQHLRHLRERPGRRGQDAVVVGQNPAVSVAQPQGRVRGPGKLDMLVVQEIWETETAAFWKRPGVDPEVDPAPRCCSCRPRSSWRRTDHRELRRDGAVAIQDGRRRRARPRPTARSSTWSSAGCATWSPARTNRGTSSSRRRSGQYGTAEDLLREINGRVYHDVPGTELKTGRPGQQGGRSPGRRLHLVRRWIYAGVFSGGKNLTKRRDSRHDPSGLGLYPEFALDLAEQHADPLQPGVLRSAREAVSRARSRSSGGTRRPAGGPGTTSPTSRCLTDGPDTPNGHRAFHLNAEGVGRLFAAVYEDPDPEDIRASRATRATSPKTAPCPRCTSRSRAPSSSSLHPKTPQQPDAQVSPRGEPPPDRHGRQVPPRAHDLDRRRALVRRLDHPERLVAERAGA